MLHTRSTNKLPARALGLAVTAALTFSAAHASADAITDWNENAVKATKGFDGTTGRGVTLNSNLSSRIEAITARAAFDAVNAVDRFSTRGYYYSGSHPGSAAAAAAQASHDVLLGQLPNPAVEATADARWAFVRAWLDTALANDLAALGVAADDGGIAAGRAAAAAALAARALDGATPGTVYGAALSPTSNPGLGVWRQSNAAGVVDPTTNAPTGFDAAGVIQGRPGIDLNWRDVAPFSLSVRQKAELVSDVPLSPGLATYEYAREVDYVRRLGRFSSTERSTDQTAQALFYKQDAEIFVFEAARIASRARGLKLAENAKLFALLANAVADARLAAFSSKYEQKFWRPITALNADANGAVTNGYAAWHPLAATPAHPSNTAGHSATGAAGFEILRAFFGDRVVPDGRAVTLTTLPWLVGTNSGTGVTTSRLVTTFSQAQLENGASRLYLGVHWGFDNLQGQLIGLAAADTIIRDTSDPAAAGVRVRDSAASYENLPRTLAARPDLYGVFFRREFKHRGYWQGDEDRW